MTKMFGERDSKKNESEKKKENEMENARTLCCAKVCDERIFIYTSITLVLIARQFFSLLR